MEKLGMICKSCNQKFNPIDYEHPLNLCSLECVKRWKIKNPSKFKPLAYRVMHQKGSGKSHIIWVQEKNKRG